MNSHDAVDSEREVTAAILLRPTALDDALTAGLRSLHFSSTDCREAFCAAVRLQERGVENLDPLIVHAESSGKLDPSWLLALLESSGATGHVAWHAQRIIDGWQRRHFGYALHDAQAALNEAGTELSSIAGTLTTAVDAALESTEHGPLSTADILLRLDEYRRSKAGRGLSTGFQRLDSLLGGLRPGNLVILAARPGLGKTSLAGAFSTNAGMAGHSSLFISLEMSAEELVTRMLSLVSGLPHKQIESGTLVDEVDCDRLADAQNRLANIPLQIDAQPTQRLSDIASSARVLKRRIDLKLLVIDYLQLIEASDKKIVREQQISDTTRSLKNLAKQLKIPIVCLCQLNRQVENRDNKRPRLADLRESGSIEQDADSVLLLQRDEDSSDAKLIIAKNRHGRAGEIDLQWDGSRMAYRESGPDC